MSVVNHNGKILEWLQSLPAPTEMVVGGKVDREFAKHLGVLDTSVVQTMVSQSCNTALMSSNMLAEMRELDTPEMRALGGKPPSCMGGLLSVPGATRTCACKPNRFVYTITTPTMGDVHLVFDTPREMIAYTQLVHRHCAPNASVVVQIYKAVALRTFIFECMMMKRVRSNGTFLWKVLPTLDNTRLIAIPSRVIDHIIAESLKVG